MHVKRINDKPRIERNSAVFIEIEGRYRQFEECYGEGSFNFDSASIDEDLDLLRQEGMELNEAIRDLIISFNCSAVKSELKEMKQGINQALVMIQYGLR